MWVTLDFFFFLLQPEPSYWRSRCDTGVWKEHRLLSLGRNSQHLLLVPHAYASSRALLVSARLSITSPGKTGVPLPPPSILLPLLLLFPTLHSPYTCCPNNHSISLRNKRGKVGGDRWGGLARCIFWQLTETSEQLESGPFLLKNTSWRRMLVLFSDICF